MRLILGESLTSLLMNYSRSSATDTIITDIWEGGSVLYGWDLSKYCIDRAPIFLNPSCPHINKLRGLGIERFELIKFNINVVGTEEGFRSKFRGIDLGHTWIQQLVSGGYIPIGGWCSFYRRLRGCIAIRRVYGYIKFVDIDRKLVKISWLECLKYDELVSTLPLHYLLTKVTTGNEEVSKLIRGCISALSYVPTYIMTLIVKGGVDQDEVIMVGKKGFQTALIVRLRPDVVYPRISGKYSLIYVITPIDIEELRPEISSRVLGELRRLNVLEDLSSIVFLRDYFEKYSLISTKNEELLNNLIGTLGNYDIKLEGRLGRWCEASLCDLIGTYLK